jgi:putative membrane protein
VSDTINYMEVLANGAVAVVALLHIVFLVVEMFLWTKPVGMRAFGLDAERARITATLAANQGLYNGFLAAGLIWSLFATGNRWPIQLFFLSCVIIAGVFGAVTVDKSILVIQAIPGVIALILAYLAN